jgi:histidine triad (HIT) family protein
MNLPDCLFCRIVRGEVPAAKVFENERVLAFRDINPQAPVHVLVIPKQHVASLDDLGDEHKALIGEIHLVGRDLAKQEGVQGNGWRWVVNVGEDAGQTVPHLHFHLLGRRRLGWPPG